LTFSIAVVIFLLVVAQTKVQGWEDGEDTDSQALYGDDSVVEWGLRRSEDVRNHGQDQLDNKSEEPGSIVRVPNGKFAVRQSKGLGAESNRGGDEIDLQSH
jgi:hypothetical protein